MLRSAGTKRYHQYLISLSLGLLLIGIGGWWRGSGKGSAPVIKGAIIPHHNVATEMVKDLGQRLKSQTVKTVVIVGPNHFGVGSSHIEMKEVENDHACTEPRTVLRKYLPETNFKCLLISDRTTSEEIKGLIEELRVTLNDNGVLVASVDFSHYLPKGMADKNDEVTKKYLENWDEVSLLKLGDHYLDSPKTIKILWDFLKSQKGVKMKTVDHFNSAQVLGIPDLTSTTSYFEVIYD